MDELLPPLKNLHAEALVRLLLTAHHTLVHAHSHLSSSADDGGETASTLQESSMAPTTPASRRS